MGERAEMKKIMSYISQGQIDDAKDVINSAFRGKWTQDVALNTLITISRSLSSPDLACKASSEVWCDAALTSCRHITFLDSKKTESYLRSLFFIVKHFIEKDEQKLLLSICRVLIPDWIQDFSEHVSIYLHLLYLIHDTIVKHCKTLKSKELVRVSLLSLRIQSYSADKNASALFNKICSYCCLIKQNPHMSEIERLEFGAHILDIVANIKAPQNDNELTEEIYRAFLYLIGLSLAQKSSFESEIDVRKRYLTRLLKMVPELCKRDEYTENVLFLEKLLGVVVKNIKNLDGNDVATLNEICKKYSNSRTLTRTFVQLSRIFRTYFEYLEEIDSETWIQNISLEIQWNYMQILCAISKIIAKNDAICDCSAKCRCKNDYVQAISVNRMCVTFVQISLAHKMVLTENMYELCLKTFAQSCKYVNTMKNELFCEKWTQNWQIVGVMMYNLGSRLYRLKEFEYAHKFYELFAMNIIRLEGVETTDVCLENALAIALHFNAVCLTSIKENGRALTILCLLMYLKSAYIQKSFGIWVTIKSKNSGSSFAEYNVNNIFVNDELELRKIYPEYKYDQGIAEKLLLEEIDYYLANWPSKASLNNAAKEFCRISNDVYKRTQVFNGIWERVISLQDEILGKELDKTIRLLEKMRCTSTLDLCLSILFYIKYQIGSYEIVKHNLKEMNEAHIPELFDGNTNPHDKCDIVPTYHSIKIENKLHLYKLLERSFVIWNCVFENDISNEIIDAVRHFKLIATMKQVAYEYRLQKFHVRMLETWHLVYKCARALNDTTEMINSLGFIIECSNCALGTTKQLMERAEQLIRRNPTSDNAIGTYYINKSTSLLTCGYLTDGYAALKTSEKHLAQTDCKILKARLLKLKSRYLVLPCADDVTGHEENYLVVAQNAFSTIAVFYREGGAKCPYALSVLFEIIVDNGWNYKWLRMPREVRCYIKEAALTAQQLVLPACMANILVLLALTDLLDGQYVDCEVKIDGLNNLLGLSAAECVKKQDFTLQTENMKKDFERLSVSTDQNVEKMLDLRFPNVGSSPVLQTRPFRLPGFLRHDLGCLCFYCGNLEYQRLVLEVFGIEAQFRRVQNDLEVSKNYFVGVQSLFVNVSERFNKLLSSLALKIVGNDDNEAFTNISKNLSLTYCTILLDYSYLQLKKNYEKANAILSELFEIIEREKINNRYFLQEVMLQKLNLLNAERVVNAENQKPDPNTLKVQYNSIVTKTPDNKMSVQKITVAISPIFEPFQTIKPAKSLKFNLSDSDEEPTARKTQFNVPFKLKTPAKTPAAKTPMSFRPTELENASVARGATQKQFEKRSRLLTERLKAEKNAICKSLMDELEDKQAVSVKRLVKSPTKLSTPIERLRRPSRLRKKAGSPDVTNRRSARNRKD